MDRVTAPDLRFAVGLHRLMATDRDRSFAWSPYSVASALGVVGAGARGATRDELAAVLGDLDELGSALAAGAAFAADPTVILSVANTLWADLTLPVADQYLAAVKAWPGGAARGADFSGNPDLSRREINAEVEHSTRGLIRDLIPAGMVDPDTRAVVVNALYLRASWAKPFDKGATRPLPFRTPAGRADVPTMRATRSMPYAAGGGWTLVTIPAGAGVVADVLLPDGDELPELDAGTLAGLLEAARPREVELELPKVTVRGQASLAEPLATLGVRLLFSDGADLTGVTGGEEGLKVDAAVHKAVLTLDEHGLEGAAATAMMMTRLAAVVGPPRPIPVHVDHPFYLLIRHRPSDTLHFLTQVTDPR
jgi:serpin B